MKASKYPQQTGKYSVKVKNGAGWHVFDTARIQVSVGQYYHEDEKLKALIEWAKHRFDKVIICINDTLQRHNLEADGMEPSAALALSEAAGREWLERNMKFIRSLPNYGLKRWEEWRSHPDYEAELERMHKLYEKNEVFRAQVDEEVLAFWERKIKRDPSVKSSDFEDFKKHAVEYLLEECAVFLIMNKRDNAVDLYPGSTLLPCKLRAVKGLGTRGYTRIGFSRNTTPVPATATQPHELTLSNAKASYVKM